MTVSSREAMLEQALKRLASMEAFVVSRAIRDTDNELIARINYARKALEDRESSI